MTPPQEALAPRTRGSLTTGIRGGSKRVANTKVRNEILLPVFGENTLLFPDYTYGLPACGT